MPSRRRGLVLEVYTFHEKGFYKRGGEEFMPSMRRAFIKEVEKSIEMCLWVAKQEIS